MRRWLRRIGIALGVFIVAVTIASFAFDEATNGREQPATALYNGPFVSVDGTKIAYRRWGTTGTPVVLIGGFVEPSWVWSKVGRLLGRTHRVVALDLPPFGYSLRRGPYTLARWVELTRAVSARLRLTRPIVVGHSLGAAVAVDDALVHPRGVSAIVLLDGDALPVGGPHWLAHLVFDPYYTSIFRIATGSDWIVGKALRGALGPHASKQTHAALERWKRPFRVSGTPAAFKQMLEVGVQGVTMHDLARVRVPRLVVWGQDDSVDSLSAGRATAAALHARLVVIRGAGHLSMLVAPRDVAAAIDGEARSIVR
jgi:pimeloyl-ACP methyl ester carboxylesterase